MNYLPSRLLLTGETAPPPINPKLQQCIEEYNFNQYRLHGDTIRSAIARANGLELQVLPKKWQKSLKASFENASKTFALRDEIAKAGMAIDAASPAYRPLHRQVRQIETVIRRLKLSQKDLQTDLRQLTGDDAAIRKVKMELRLEEMKTKQKELEASRPAEWTERHKSFASLLKADKKARLLYRRNVDGAYESVREAVVTIAAAEELASLQNKIEGIREVINSQEAKTAAKHIAELLPEVGAVAGARGIRSKLSNVRRALRGRSPDKTKALKRLDTAIKTYREELAWRQSASGTVLGGLRTYEKAIRNTIGLRKQNKLPKDIAIEVASCTANHRDISLHF